MALQNVRLGFFNLTSSRGSLRRAGAVRPLDETGTHRSDSGDCRLSVVGITALPRYAGSRQAEGGEDVKFLALSILLLLG